MLTIAPPTKGSKRPLLCQPMGEFEPLPAYIELGLKHRVVNFTYWERNTEPLYVTLGHARRWRINAMTSRRAAIRLAKELEPLFERLCDGYAVDWNGRHLVGVLDAHAQTAAEEVSARLKEYLWPEAV
ncbi:hypothetical protein JQ557_00860 [Bradyrhizobium sp. U87765 SZCCT0131]|uniref:hypothetical protein n=1 Tax=unclassified Bradyrhizobium TaxID=2631580 RepID=UPI001BAAAAF4|nr:MULTISPECIES: hypothetical protein [unclassified Bradyrhizobium]MBR1216522.1 hypothetical protein [Bradyrhizobium sp. U87765 SZCCT0131]MBR1259722.1 hypothetical protein [Bradyrhizobium sp. U87765 SZCCT0134]MBR1305863.1 hypothetical protein [Bradyrhizobium sp. U87765 SZCCT0110]MBR1322230.1 hypothetical protein [Bradyrhizobium sp. U87765 SZCCT0109]MBR1350491.1 hypothetical protein [Bradyrhizobium sp. U87765 SZCCT0048]